VSGNEEKEITGNLILILNSCLNVKLIIIIIIIYLTTSGLSRGGSGFYAYTHT
jgi:hypothetical protein